MSRRLWIVNGVVLLLVLLAAGGTTYALTKSSSSSANSTLRTTPVGRGTVAETVTAAGTVTTAASATLNFGVSGKIAEIRVRLGDHVTTGQTLARLDGEFAQANLTAADAQVAADEQALADAEYQKDHPAATTTAAAGASTASARRARGDHGYDGHDGARRRYDGHDRRTTRTSNSSNSVRTDGLARTSVGAGGELPGVEHLLHGRSGLDDARGADGTVEHPRYLEHLEYLECRHHPDRLDRRHVHRPARPPPATVHGADARPPPRQRRVRRPPAPPRRRRRIRVRRRSSAPRRPSTPPGPTGSRPSRPRRTSTSSRPRTAPS